MLNDFKKLLFGAKSVAKSATNKAVEAGKEVGEDLVEKSNEFIEKAADTAGEFYEKAAEKAGELYHAAKGKVEDITESIWETASKNMPASESTPPKTAGTTDDFVASSIHAQTKAETPKDPLEGEDIFDAIQHEDSPTERQTTQTPPTGTRSELEEKAAELKSKLKEVAEDVGAKLAEKGSELVDRAREASGQLKEKFDSLVDKAQQEAEKDRLEKEAIQREAERQRAEWQKRAANKSEESTLGNMGSFFEKAQRFAEGDYHNTGGQKPVEDDPNVLELKPDPNFKKDKKEGKVPGMDDLDGDGNELIDDAIIDKD